MGYWYNIIVENFKDTKTMKYTDEAIIIDDKIYEIEDLPKSYKGYLKYHINAFNNKEKFYNHYNNYTKDFYEQKLQFIIKTKTFPCYIFHKVPESIEDYDRISIQGVIDYCNKKFIEESLETNPGKLLDILDIEHGIYDKITYEHIKKSPELLENVNNLTLDEAYAKYPDNEVISYHFPKDVERYMHRISKFFCPAYKEIIKDEKSYRKFIEFGYNKDRLICYSQDMETYNVIRC